MRQAALLYGLCSAQLLALGALAKKADECLRGPLILEDRQTCEVFKPEKKPTFKDEKWEWKGEKSDAWDGPYDCMGAYCVFVNRELGDGMVLISAEQNVHVIDSFPKKTLLQHGAPPYYVAKMPGKGIGLVANRTIKKGETIMETTPAMLVQFGPHLDFDGDTRLELFQRAAKRLPKPTYEAFMRQYGADEYIKVDRNSFRLFINGEKPFSGHLAIYPYVAQMNHDCRPNVHYRMDNITHFSVAITDIPAGTELTVSYIDGHLSRTDRQSRLDDWGFQCDCAHCTMPAADVAASDARMERIHVVEDVLEKMVSGTQPINTTLADELVRLYEAERFWTYIGQAYTRAALLHSLMGHADETRVYAKKAADAMELEFGAHNRDTQAMKLLAEDMEAHWSWDAMRKKSERKEEQKKMAAEQDKKEKMAWKAADITEEDVKDLKK